jgi:hypothetical protein
MPLREFLTGGVPSHGFTVQKGKRHATCKSLNS